MAGRSMVWPLGVAGVALAASLAFAVSEYRIATTEVPATASLVTIEGDLESCTYDTLTLLHPFRATHGGWGGTHSYVLTIKGHDGQFRTSVYGCGKELESQAGPLPAAHRVSFSAVRRDSDSWSGEADPLHAYGFAVNGEVLRRVEDDLDLHRRAHDVVAPLNTAGFVLLACIAPVWTYRAARRRQGSRVTQTVAH